MPETNQDPMVGKVFAMKKKLLISGISLFLAIALLAGASFAWMTVSTRPEASGMTVTLFTDRSIVVSDSEDGDYEETLDLSSVFSSFVDLHPVSTVDGLVWFIPEYDTETGMLTGEFTELDNYNLYEKYTHANVLGVDDKGVPLTGQKLQDAQELGYFVYGDFWIKTEDQDVDVRLSVPTAGKIDETDLGGKYGTYVLPDYALNSDKNAIVYAGSGGECAVRIGFEITTKDEEENETRQFIIFEPNADKRTLNHNKLVGEDEGSSYYGEYLNVVNGIAAYSGIKPADYKNGSYFRTKYVTYETDGEGNFIQRTDEGGHLLYLDPLGDLTTEEKTDGVDNPKAYKTKLVDVKPENHIVQYASAWDGENSVQTTGEEGIYAFANVTSGKLFDALKEGNEPDSTAVSSFGHFIKSKAIFDALGDDGKKTSLTSISTAAVDTTTDAVLLTLKKDVPVKIRMFVWLEGQDIDCWNDVTSGTFRVNLEFAGMTVVPEDDSES